MLSKLKLLRKIGLPKFGEVASSAMWMTKLSANMITDGNEKNVVACDGDWETERDDILERANWLCEKVVTSPEKLIAEAPSVMANIEQLKGFFFRR